MSDDPTPEGFDETQELAYLRDTPVESIVGNHLFVLLQVAALRLATEPADLAGAQLVIDTVSAILGATSDRLGEHEALYRSALAEIQQAYVRAAAH